MASKITFLIVFAIATVLLTSTIVTMDDAFAAEKKEKKVKSKVDTKLQKRCLVDPKTPDKIRPECELLGLFGTVQTGILSIQFQIDSFFDILVEVQATLLNHQGRITANEETNKDLQRQITALEEKLAETKCFKVEIGDLPCALTTKLDHKGIE